MLLGIQETTKKQLFYLQRKVRLRSVSFNTSTGCPIAVSSSSSLKLKLFRLTIRHQVIYLHRENRHLVARSLWLEVTKGSVANAYLSKYWGYFMLLSVYLKRVLGFKWLLHLQSTLEASLQKIHTSQQVHFVQRIFWAWSFTSSAVEIECEVDHGVVSASSPSLNWQPLVQQRILDLHQTELMNRGNCLCGGSQVWVLTGCNMAPLLNAGILRSNR